MRIMTFVYVFALVESDSFVMTTLQSFRLSHLYTSIYIIYMLLVAAQTAYNRM